MVGVRRAHARRLAPQARDDGREAVAAPASTVDCGALTAATQHSAAVASIAAAHSSADPRTAVMPPSTACSAISAARIATMRAAAAREGPALRALAVPGAGRRELAERVAEHGVGRHAAAPQRRVEGHLHGEERGLRVRAPSRTPS